MPFHLPLIFSHQHKPVQIAFYQVLLIQPHKLFLDQEKKLKLAHDRGGKLGQITSRGLFMRQIIFSVQILTIFLLGSL
jgi:hypothetical protein